MIEQRILVNSGYKGVNPVVHMVQNDTGRTLVCELADYVVDDVGTGASLLCQRPDGSYYSYSGTIDFQDNTVTFVMDDEGGALSQAGVVKTQLMLTDSNDLRIKSYDIKIVVDEEVPDALPTPAESAYVDALQSQYDAYIAQKSAQITQNANDITDLQNLVGLTKFSLVNVPISGSATVTFPASVGTRALMICLGYSQGTKGLYLLTCATNGTVSYVAVQAGSNISITTGTNSITVSNSSTASGIYIHFITFAGGVVS